MKATRFLSFLIMAIFVVTILAPTPVYAQPAQGGTPKTSTLIVNNESGGTLRVYLSGPRSYFFLTAKSGKTQFTGIEPGTYTITVSATTCFETVTVTKKISGKFSLRESVCEQKQGKDKKAPKLSSLRVDNRTGGGLFITLVGPKSYYFYTYTQGKSTFDNIEGGKYTITVTSSACGGSLTYTKNFNGKVSLKPFICR